MTEQRKNSFDDSDMTQILEEIEGLVQEQVLIRAEAAGRCGGISKKIGNAKGRAKELGIPLTILGGLLKTRKLERQIAAVADGIPDDFAEVWEDAAGQFSMFKPEDEDDEPAQENAAQAAARKRKATADKNEAEEQVAGAAVLDQLTKH